MKEKQQKFEVRIWKLDKILSWAFLLLFSVICITTKENYWIGNAMFFYSPIIDWILLLIIKNFSIFEKYLKFRAKRTEMFNGTFEKIGIGRYTLTKVSIIFLMSSLVVIFNNIWMCALIGLLFGIVHSIACNYVKVIKIADE